jgi:hypothetical protein
LFKSLGIHILNFKIELYIYKKRLLIKVWDMNLFLLYTFLSFSYFYICKACNPEYQATITCLDNYGYRIGTFCINGCTEEHKNRRCIPRKTFINQGMDSWKKECHRKYQTDILRDIKVDVPWGNCVVNC